MTAAIVGSGPRIGRAMVVALGIDLACIVVFVAVGRENHGVTRGDVGSRVAAGDEAAAPGRPVEG